MRSPWLKMAWPIKNISNRTESSKNSKTKQKLPIHVQCFSLESSALIEFSIMRIMKYDRVCTCCDYHWSWVCTSYSFGTGIRPFFSPFSMHIYKKKAYTSTHTHTHTRAWLIQRIFWSKVDAFIYLQFWLTTTIIIAYYRVSIEYMWCDVKKSREEVILLLVVVHRTQVSPYDYRYCYFISRSFLYAFQTLKTELYGE